MDFYEEMQWREMIHNHTPGVDNFLKNQSVAGYIGFDPTAPSLTIGNYVQIMILKLFQLSGHQPIVLMGGATGRIGDPSGKSEERKLKSEEELDENLKRQLGQLKKFLDFENSDNKALLVNNLDFYKDMNVLNFLRDVGKGLTVNYMLAKDSVKNRLETGISFTEFSYQLIQAYDFQTLYQQYDCRLQMGGSDQWGNITAGTELIRRNLMNAKAYALTTPLLTKADGSKFGKSAEGNIWLDSEYTSPYQMYQFWLNAADEDLPKFLKYFSLKPREEIMNLIERSSDEPRVVKAELAKELTSRIHSEVDAESAGKVSAFLFGKKIRSEEARALTKNDLEVIASEIPSFHIPRSTIEKGTPILELLAGHTEITSSKGEARRAIQGKAVAINKEKVEAIDREVTASDLLHDRFILIDNGKKNKFILVLA